MNFLEFCDDPAQKINHNNKYKQEASKPKSS